MVVSNTSINASAHENRSLNNQERETLLGMLIKTARDFTRDFQALGYNLAFDVNRMLFDDAMNNITYGVFLKITEDYQGHISDEQRKVVVQTTDAIIHSDKHVSI